ncbi:hypothetical protein AX777_20575 [Sphingobium yanoikuyae]|uniref:Long-chain fatty acid--CoA ligase n=1 Tax=Sphingobium yanoikuyae TaxID=13690 RepID=A0A177JUG6_SPHYA|nr:hypothetical protein AX777_20575 [Sphingobium yanoikuyae]
METDGLNAHLLRHAVALPNGVALVEQDRVVTYGALPQLVDDAAALLKTLDVRAGDRVMLVCENCIDLLVATMACWKIDAWPVLINARIAAREVDQIRQHCAPRRILFGIENSAAARDHAERYSAVRLQNGPLGAMAASSTDIAAVAEPVPDHISDRCAVMLYTSGSTGTPKGVMLSHRNVMLNARAVADLLGVAPGDRIYCALPLSHILAFTHMFLVPLLTGATVELMPRFDVADVFTALSDRGVTVLYGVPASFQRMLDQVALSSKAAVDAPDLRFALVAGAPLDATLKARIEEALGAPLLNHYGSTEHAPNISGSRWTHPPTGVHVGPLIPGVEARLVASDGTVLGDGATGVLQVRSACVMLGYYKAPDLTAAVIDADGWFDTGDIAHFDTEGNLHIVGRAKELIIRSGFNVYPAEVEAVLNAHPAVAQSAVVGRSVPDNEEVVAFVELAPGASLDAATLRRHAEANLAPYKRPSEIRILDALPCNATGKILKPQLKIMAAEIAEDRQPEQSTAA